VLNRHSWFMRNVALCLMTLVAAIPRASAACIDWSASGRFADIESSVLVFEGVVERIEQDTSSECAPDRVVFRPTRVWKGEKAKEFVLLQSTSRMHEALVDGRRTISGCPSWSEQDRFDSGRAYIVFASGSKDKLQSRGCGLSSEPKGGTRKRLNAWLNTRAGNK